MISERVKHYVGELAGNRSDDAWHSLVDIGPSALMDVIRAFQTTCDRSVAVNLIRVVNEYRTQAALPFLANLVGDADPSVWKTALDGIAAIGGSAAVNQLQELRETLSPEKRSWIEEAVEQITAKDG